MTHGPHLSASERGGGRGHARDGPGGGDGPAHAKGKEEEEGGLLLSWAGRGREGGMNPSGLLHFPNLFPFPRFIMHLF